MARSPRDRFLRERERCRDVDDPDVADALGVQFADALDPEVPHVELPKLDRSGVLDGHESASHSTAKNYLNALRCTHQRGLDLLGADAETVNAFMDDLVVEPEERRYDLVEGDGSIGKPYAKQWQSALRVFYRFCTEPTRADDRPSVGVTWEDVNGSKNIRMYSARSTPKHKTEGAPREAELEALRQACLAGQNTRRDQAFLEMAAGTGQRVYALVTLRVGDVRGHIDGTADYPFSHIELNPAIKNDGDKGAIENTGGGLIRPFVGEPGPVKEWIEHHPLSDPDVRAEVGAPEDFDDCYLFVGSLRQRSTDPTDHWGDDAARDMLKRRKGDTVTLVGVETVDVPVNPHAWRHYAYTRSKTLPIDEADRRRMFGWVRGSDTGERLYDDNETADAAGRIAEAFAEASPDDEQAASVASQVLGEAVTEDLSDEALSAIVQQLATDEDAMAELGQEVLTALD